MNQKRCPHCGEYVQNSSLTCPKCFREIPRGSVSTERAAKEDKKGKQRKVSSAAVLLSVIPPFAGLLGLGIIYSDPRSRTGYGFLAAGLLLFICALALFFVIRNSGFFSAVLSFAALAVVLVLYVLAALAALIETLFGSVLKALGF